MNDFSLAVDQSPGSGRFAATSNCRFDFPIETVFTKLFLY